MYFIAKALILILVVQIQVHQCDLHTNLSENHLACQYNKNRLKCTDKNIPWEYLNITKSSVLYLYMENSQISNINYDTFEGLTNLERLSLSNNNITKIEKLTFTQLMELKYLYLTENLIETIEDGAFEELSHLTFIDLEGNQLTRIHSGTFSNCSCLQQVHLTRNNIEEIEENSFRENSTLRHFYGLKNKISDLDFLKNLPMLMFLDLSHNNIEFISAASLLNMVNLIKLNLSHNKLKVLYSGTLNELRVLNSLNLSSNKLENLGAGPFNRVRNLQYLDLRNNSLNGFSYGTDFENRSCLVIYIDKNHWYCNFIHQLLQLKQIKLYCNELHKNISNVDGVPCRDEMKYIRPSEIVTSQTHTSTTLTHNPPSDTTTAIRTIPTAPSRRNITVTTISTTSVDDAIEELNSKKNLEKMIFTSTNSLNTTTETMYVTIPEIKVNLSLILLGIIIAVVVIIIAAIIVFKSASKRNTCKNGYLSDPDLTKDGYMRPRPTPPRTSNFYVTLDAYNTYEEVDADSEHIYEMIDETLL